MTWELEINGMDARVRWGVSLGYGSLTALMTPPPMKDYITNESAAAHGKVIANSASAMPKVDSREVQLTVFLQADSAEAFYSKYASFVEELQGGQILLRTRYQPEVMYRLYYLSCSQFSNFNGRLGKFVLRLSEPNPMNRSRNVDD